MKDNKLFLIPKISLWALLAIGIVAIAAVFLGGNEEIGYIVAGDELAVPNFTDFFLGVNYSFFCLAVLATLFFVCLGFAANFKKDKKKSLLTLGVLVAIVALFCVCWFLGSPEKIDIIGYEGADNEGFWAQLSDMMMYVTYTLFAGTLIAIVWGAIYTRIKK